MSLKELVMKFADETMKDVIDNSSTESKRDKYKDAISKLLSSIEHEGTLLPTGANDFKLTIKITDNTSVVEETDWQTEDNGVNGVISSSKSSAIETQERVVPIQQTEETIETRPDTNERVNDPIHQAEERIETKDHVKLTGTNERIVQVELAD